MADNRTIQQIEADITVARERLSRTVDELAFRAQPKEIARRQGEALKLKANDAVKTSDGQLRTQRIATVAGAVLGGVALLLLTRRTLHKNRKKD